jgi:hypothetical protein
MISAGVLTQFDRATQGTQLNAGVVTQLQQLYFFYLLFIIVFFLLKTRTNKINMNIN